MCARKRVIRNLRKCQINSARRTVARRIIYESPLKHLRERFTLGHNKIKQCKRRKSFLTDQPNMVNDSVIILSDSEVESSKEPKRNDNKNTNIKSDQTLLGGHSQNRISSEHKRVTPARRSRRIASQHTQCSLKKRKSIEILDIDSSCLLLSDNEDSESCLTNIDEENVEPSQESHNQTNDEITVIWTSKVPVESNKNEAACSTNEVPKRKEEEPLFRVDHSMDLKNLECLKDNFKPRLKRRKLNCENKSPVNNGGSQLARCSMPSISSHNICRSKNQTASNGNLKKHFTQPADKRNVQHTALPSGCLREIIVDGCNVAMAYTNDKYFSEVGIKIVLDYFVQKGHAVKVFVPQHKRSLRHQLLEKLYSDGIVVFTPSRKVGKKSITPYDDRYILEYATRCGGVVVSSDQYRDLYQEKPEWRETIANRLLPPTFVGEYVMFPDDPLGRSGPTLDEFLRH